MKPSARLLLPALLGGLLVSAAVPETAPAALADGFDFSLLPGAFSPNPRLMMTVFTDMTAHGRTLPAASREKPVHFVALDEGLRSEGEPTGGGLPPPPAALQDILFRSLSAGGYEPAGEGTPPGLILIYYWGSHYAMDLDFRNMFPERHDRQMMERALLVGGRDFRRKIGHQIEFGYTFADRGPKDLFLIQQAAHDMYFVVVSAYDYAEMAAGRRRLAWRTTMTVSTSGVAMRDALPPLVVTSGDYFGRETSEPVAIKRRVRRGTVTLGPLRIIANHPPAAGAQN